MPEIVGNVVKLTIFRKIREKSRRGQTGSSCVLWPTFGVKASQGRGVIKTGRRHISTSGLGSRAPETLLSAVFWLVRQYLAKSPGKIQQAGEILSILRCRRIQGEKTAINDF